MSRLGRKPITVPSNVKINVNGSAIDVEGPKGKLSYTMQPHVSVALDGSELLVSRRDDERDSKAYHGLTRSLIQNMIVGVSEGYSRGLEVQGVGYNATLKGKKLELAVGFANKIVREVPDGVEVKVDGGTKIEISGIDKQKVGQFAAVVRSARKPEPYKGKGIRYEGEAVKIKAGKAFAGAGSK